MGGGSGKRRASYFSSKILIVQNPVFACDGWGGGVKKAEEVGKDFNRFSAGVSCCYQVSMSAVSQLRGHGGDMRSGEEFKTSAVCVS